MSKFQFQIAVKRGQRVSICDFKSISLASFQSVGSSLSCDDERQLLSMDFSFWWLENNFPINVNVLFIKRRQKLGIIHKVRHRGLSSDRNIWDNLKTGTCVGVGNKSQTKRTCAWCDVTCRRPHESGKNFIVLRRWAISIFLLVSLISAS